MLQAISHESWRKVSLAFYAAGILVHALVIGQVIPYGWVNGGMSPSYSFQAMQSAISLVALSMMAGLVWGISKKKQPKRWQKTLLYVLAGFWLLGCVLQLIGTPFERYVMSIVLLLGAISHVRLAQKG